jgi:trehalose 6-phosphate phosphatase
VRSDALEAFASAPEAAGIFLDFDGTLSEIAHVPSAARPIDGAREVLTRLADRFRLVAVVSGRSARELLEWLGPEVEIWGTHGAERTTHDGRVELSERARPYSDLMSRVREDAVRRIGELSIEGILVEDKNIMIGLHFRAAADVEAARAALDELAEELTRGYGLQRAGGRLAFELRPPVEFSKAQVVLQRSREVSLKAVTFVGDDRVDLPAFDALDVLADEGAVTMRVAVDSDEVPQELIERADVIVSGPFAVVEFLNELAAH